MVEIEVIQKYNKAFKRLILLDYDGTLVNYAPFPDQAKPSDELLHVFEKLVEHLHTTVFIISGREYNDIEKLIGHFPIGLIAEHGAMIRENGIWRKETPGNGHWKHTLLPIFNRLARACPNSFVEEKYFSLSWHYRNSESKEGHLYSRELIQETENIVQSYHLRIMDGNKIVEVVNGSTGKDIIVKSLLNRNTYDFVLAIGDDKTDEDMFRVMVENENALTIKVGGGATLAKYRLNNVTEVHKLLNNISQCD